MKRLQIIMPDGAKFEGEAMPQEQTETKPSEPRTIAAIAADLDIAHAHRRDADAKIEALETEMDAAMKAGRRGLRKGR